MRRRLITVSSFASRDVETETVKPGRVPIRRVAVTVPSVPSFAAVQTGSFEAAPAADASAAAASVASIVRRGCARCTGISYSWSRAVAAREASSAKSARSASRHAGLNADPAGLGEELRGPPDQAARPLRVGHGALDGPARAGRPPRERTRKRLVRARLRKTTIADTTNGAETRWCLHLARAGLAAPLDGAGIAVRRAVAVPPTTPGDGGCGAAGGRVAGVLRTRVAVVAAARGGGPDAHVADARPTDGARIGHALLAAATAAGDRHVGAAGRRAARVGRAGIPVVACDGAVNAAERLEASVDRARVAVIAVEGDMEAPQAGEGRREHHAHARPVADRTVVRAVGVVHAAAAIVVAGVDSARVVVAAVDADVDALVVDADEALTGEEAHAGHIGAELGGRGARQGEGRDEHQPASPARSPAHAHRSRGRREERVNDVRSGAPPRPQTGRGYATGTPNVVRPVRTPP